MDSDAVARMCAAQVHRGPDSAGFHSGEGVALGVRRLAIIDVEGGDQPIYSEDRSVAVILNGEIYNFAELRERLETKGHRFATSSDTEVIVHLYEERGVRLVEDLRGMFAFALWDTRERRLLLARDRVGKKPLYYRFADGRLSFASELAALLEDRTIPRRVDPQAIDAYLALLYVPDPLCAIEGVRKLPPAHTLVWHEGRIQLERYWQLDFSRKESGSQAEIGEQIRAHLTDAVRLRLVSERPLGAFLSGGVDSAAVVATMAEVSSGPLKTFSVGFASDRFNELPYARRVAELFSTDHTELLVEPDALAILPKLITHYGDPFGDSSAIPSFYVAEAASREVTVALNGDGGDESFAGYNRYVSNSLGARLDVLPFASRRALATLARAMPDPKIMNSTPARLRRLLLSLSLPAPERYAMRMTYCSDALRRELYTPQFSALLDAAFVHETIGAPWRRSTATSTVDRMLDVDVQTYLPGDLLVKMDIATMANSLEARSPFLDHVLMEMAARLPVSAKVRGLTTKVGLKSAFHGRLPEDLLERPKSGFSIPLAEWLRGRLSATVRDVLLDRRTVGREVMRTSTVEKLLREHAEDRADRSSELWLLFVLELWQRRFIDGEPEAALL